MRRTVIRRLTVMAGMILAMVAFASPAWADTTFTVNSTGDLGDDNTADGNCDTGEQVFRQIGGFFLAFPECTLRAAIQQANATAGADTIAFDISGASGAVHTISPDSDLPSITEAVTIDGYTQPGASPNTLKNGDDAHLKIELSGANAGALSTAGLRIRASFTTVRGLAINRWAGAGVTIEGGLPSQFLGDPHGVKVEGNFIGTDVTGTRDLGNSLLGVSILDAPANTVGGTMPAARNVISGNDGGGVQIFGEPGFPSGGNKIQGNYIGAKKDGTGSLGNGYDGVVLSGSSGNTVGGGAAARNVIAFNDRIGVLVDYINTKGNRILSNSIHSNERLGIDLIGEGGNVTPNDPGDADTGGNTFQNYPVLTSATTSGGETTIRGRLNSTPNRIFTVQFFSSPQADPSGFGEGQTLIGGMNVETNASGNASFVFRPAQAVPAGWKVSATATDNPLGNTSEFSGVRTVAPDRTRPTITRPAPRPGAALRRPNVRIQATVRDGQMELAKNHIRLFVDGRRKTGFTYNRTTDRLSFTARNLPLGRHNVRVVAFDDAGNAANRTWGFKMVRR